MTTGSHPEVDKKPANSLLIRLLLEFAKHRTWNIQKSERRSRAIHFFHFEKLFEIMLVHDLTFDHSRSPEVNHEALLLNFL